MTIAKEFVSWQKGREPGAPFDKASPNLTLVQKYLKGRWGMDNLGCYVVRPIRGGSSWSSHAFGAALDIGYSKKPGLAVVEAEVIPFLVDHSFELGLQRVHHYKKQRYWQAGKGWIERSPGAGDQWLHLEVTPTTWGWDTPIEQRLTGITPPASSPVSTSQPSYPGVPLKLGAKGEIVKAVQKKVGATPDGGFGPRTEALVKEWQQKNGLTADGVVGPKTWEKMFA